MLIKKKHIFQVSWKDIAGLDNLIQELRETVILPIQKRELFADSRLTQPPKGVLLHGPPGNIKFCNYFKYYVMVLFIGIYQSWDERTPGSSGLYMDFNQRS